MHKTSRYKGIVLGIILLFVGGSISPGICGQVENIRGSKEEVDTNNSGFLECQPINTMEDAATTGGRGWSVTEVVSDECDFCSDRVTLDVDSFGTVHFAWQDSSGSADIHVFYRSRTNWGMWTGIDTVSSSTIYFAMNPSLVAEPDGTVHVVWDDSWYAGQQNDIIYRKKLADDGWLPWEIVSTETNSDLGPTTCVDRFGTVHVAWASPVNYQGAGTDWDIFYKKKPRGEGWTPTEVVSTESTGVSSPHLGEGISMVVDREGTVHIVWVDGTNYQGCASDFDIFYKKKPCDGNWTVTEVVSTESTQVSDAPSLAVDEYGTVHVVWHDDTDFGDPSWTRIVYKNRPRDGSWSASEVVSTGSLAFKMYPSLDVDFENNLHVAWCAGSGSDYDIYYRMKPFGENWSATELVSTESWDNSVRPSLAADVFGTLHCAWEDDTDNYGGSGTDRDVFYKYKIGGAAGLPQPTGCFEMQRTPHPRIMRFTATNVTYTEYATLKWDFDGDLKWDRTGPYSEVHTLTYKYPTEGEYNATLCIENPTGTISCSNDLVVADYDITQSNPDFFLSYNSSVTGLLPLKNKYTIATPQGIFDKVKFSIGPFHITDATPEGVSLDVWEGVVHMNEGQPGDQVLIQGIINDQVVYTEKINTKIIPTPGWFVTFLRGSIVNVDHEGGFSKWIMDVQPVTYGMTFGIPDVDCKFIGGDYGLDASVDTPDEFTIDSSMSLSVELVKGTFGVNMELGDYPNTKVKVGISFQPSANVQIDQQNGVVLVGWLTIEGTAGVSFDIPLFCIPFLVEAGITGGVDGSVSIGFSIAKFTGDGTTFCPGKEGKVSFTIGAHAGVYGEIAKGYIGRVEGGLEAEGTMTMELPSQYKTLELYGGAYAKASALHGVWSDEWKTGIRIKKSLRGTCDSMISLATENSSRITQTMDLLCLKDGEYETFSSDDGVFLLAGNVADNADPQLVLTQDGNGLAVWTDLSVVDAASLQTDIWWSEYSPATGWGDPVSMNTTSLCEFDPTLAVVEDDQGNHSIVMTYLVINDTFNENTSITEFYKNTTVHTAYWTNITGWSFSGENLTLYNTTVNAKDLAYTGNNTLYLTYLVDSNAHPWENGNGSIYVVRGEIQGAHVIWDTPVLVKDLGTNLNFSCTPHVSFPSLHTGGITYTWWNHSSGINEIIISATISDIAEANFSELLLRSTEENIEYVSSNVVNGSIIVSWVENHSRICSREILVNESLPPEEWLLGDTMVIYDGLALSYAQPVFSETSKYYLFQMQEGFIPVIIEQLANGSWSHQRQIALEGPYASGQLKGACGVDNNQMIYLRDTPLEDWQVGHWKFNEGTGTTTTDSSEYGNDAEILGDTQWVQHSEENLSIDEEYGYYLSFSDAEEYVNVPHNTSLNATSEFTTTCWVHLNALSPSPGTPLLKKNNSWELCENNGSLEVKLWRATETTVLSNITDLHIGNWTFIAVVYDHGDVMVSVSPLQGSNVTVDYTLEDLMLNSSSSPLRIGGFNGCIDEVRFLTRAVTNATIGSIWFAPYATLGGYHDVLVQPLPSFAEFNYSIGREKNGDATTEGVVQFTGSPDGFNFSWDFGDGTHSEGAVVTHQFTTSGFYTVVCNACDPTTHVVTPLTQTLYVRDTTTPVFAGLASATAGDSSVTLTWEPAQDTSPFLLYHIFMRGEGDTFNYSSPSFVTSNTSYLIMDLTPNSTYYFVVRAQDAAGNHDSNTVERSAIPLDLSPPQFEGLAYANNISNVPQAVFLSWDDAEDPSIPISYNVYMATVSGGQNFDTPLGTTIDTWYEATGLSDQVYYFVVRAEDSFGHEDDNTIELSARPFIDADSPQIMEVEVTPPVQDIGGWVNITCTIVDNAEIVGAQVNITYPDASQVNQTMAHLPGTDHYYYNTTYIDVGTYAVYIWALDTNNNSIVSPVSYFDIRDISPPTITNVSDCPDPQLVSGAVNITCDVTDNVEVASVNVIITYPNQSSVNVTMTPGYFYNTTYAQKGVYSYYIWAKDTSGNQHTSPVYTFNISSVINVDTGDLFVSLQNAIDDPDTLDGHTISVFAGVYHENVNVDKAVTIVGEEKTTTIIDGDQAGDVVSITVDNVSLSKFTIRNTTTASAGITISSAQNTISDTIIMDTGHGIHLTSSSSHNHLSDNVLIQNDKGLVLLGSMQNVIINNSIITNVYGIYSNGSSHTTITENTITTGVNDGIYLYSSTNITIDQNTITGNTVGIYSEYSYDTMIANNTLSDNEEGIVLFNTTMDTLAGNTFEEGWGGCLLDHVSYTTLVDNAIKNNSYPGVELYSSNNITLFRNDIRGNIDGVLLTDSVHNTIEENTIVQNYYGVELVGQAHYNTITHNNLTWNFYDGVYLWESSHNMITNNYLAHNSYGVYLSSSSFNTIAQNTITNLSVEGTGITLSWQSSNNEVVGNTISENDWGLLVVDESDDNVIYHNNLVDNGENAYEDYCTGNLWDNGYPCGGNHWSDYVGQDLYHGPNQNMAGSDGIGDSAYPINVGISQDQYPLMVPWSGITGDLDGDRDVDLSDLAQLLAHYGSHEATWWNGDMDGDGDVDLSDLAALLANYGTGT